ncbi:uncharacterized protein LOC133969961 isoform X1 [Platichthys flesus]|uniref:uncharacterized protein LOC133969961 isoform X1 n=2 Tax=Platichthys flesus TaxID=8260 RepID=UPI002DBCA8A4|nr:uncharacterized protein LOC133969961 isoform X1 [Platichthys flesus]
MTETSLPTMETHTHKQGLNNGQLIYVPHKDTIRLLEVFVKRSLSVNDGSLSKKGKERKEKWVTKKDRRHSSDPSLHLHNEDSEIGSFIAIKPSNDLPETFAKEPKKQKKRSWKNRKPSFWKSIVGFFSGKSSEERDEEQDSATEPSRDSTLEMASEATITCLPTTPAASLKKSSRKKSMKRRFSKRRISLIKPNRPGKDLIAADISDFGALTRVEPTEAYYEKVSEELEKIVLEVKEKEDDRALSDEVLINRIIALTKEEGDAIDIKMKDNPTLNSFFQGMSYNAFQKLADAYLEKEATPTHNPPTVLATAPELVNLAFTLDFTAMVAKLSRQNASHITGLGNRYLQDRFEYNQACTDHPWSDSED